MKLALICAMASNRVIGDKNSLPWRLSDDLKYFKRVTMGSCIIMGRKTWESIGRPLPGRTNIVLTSNTEFYAEGATVVSSLDEAMSVAEKVSAEAGMDEAFVIGGAALYKAALPFAQRFHLTSVHANVEGDTSLVEFDESDWIEESREDFSKSEANEFDFSIRVLRKRP
ncbi:MAG: dihydrofolate reductase [Pseudohongiellaceae bacterium]|jgi:dihydrofolate reductase